MKTLILTTPINRASEFGATLLNVLKRTRLGCHCLPALLLFLIALGLASVSPLVAGTSNVTIPNFSFENPANSSDNIQMVYHDQAVKGTYFIQDWTFSAPNDAEYGTINYNEDSDVTGGLASQGADIVSYYGYLPSYLTSGNTYLNDGTPAGSTGYVANVVANTTYNLTVGIAVPEDTTGTSVTLSLIDANGTSLASKVIPYSTLTSTLTDQTLQFTSSASPADVGQGIKVQFTVLNDGVEDEAVFDNVRLTESGPNITSNIQPYIFHSSKSAGPGDVIGLQGDNFGSNPQVWMRRVIGTETSLTPQTQLQVVTSSNISATALIPATQTLGLYAIWVYNNGVPTGPVFINRAESWGAPDLAGLAVDPNRAFRLFGHNLLLSGATPSVKFVNGSTSIAATITTTGSDAYGLHITAPSSLVPGTAYTIQVNNGFGGDYGTTSMANTLTARAAGADPFGLGVPWGADFTAIAANVYNVKTDSRLATHAIGNGVADDTAAIQNAIFTASGAGGGTVYLPTGTYLVHVPVGGNSVAINLANNVVLKGDGMTATQLKLTGYNPANYGFTFGSYACTRIGLYNLGFYNTATGTSWNVDIGSSSETFAIGCQFLADAGKDAIWGYNTGSVIRNCSIKVNEQNGVNVGQPAFFVGDIDTVFTGNTLSYYWARTTLMNSTRILIEQNTIARIALNNGVMMENGGFDISDDRQIALVNNTITHAGTGAYADANSGESVASQSDEGYGQVSGTVTAATATTLTDSTQSWTVNYGAQPNPGQPYYAAIISGPGTGQIRPIVSSTANSVTVTPAWDETPTAASGYVVETLHDNQALIKGNSLSQLPVGIQLWQAGLLDVTIANNTLNDAGGIMILPYASAPPTTVMDTVVVGNSVTSTVDTYHAVNSYARISIDVDYNEDTGTATSSLGTEFRNNTVTAAVPNPWIIDNPGSPWGREGFAALVEKDDGTPWANGATMAQVGTIFDRNTAHNTTFAYHLTTGDYNTTIWDPTNNNVTNMLDDEAGSGSGHASVGTARSDLIPH